MTRSLLKNNVIWDLSGTLLTMSTNQLNPQELAYSSLLLSLWGGKKDFSFLDSLAVSFMESIPFEGKQHSGIVRNPLGQPIPEIVYRFLAGMLSSNEASHLVTIFLKPWEDKHVSLSKEESLHLKHILMTFFNPSAIARCFVEDKSLKQTLKAVSHNPSIRNFILSNWDKDSFSLIYKEYKQPLFSFFKENDIVISGLASSLKPEKAVFHYFLNKYQLPPESFLFIDDQADNIAAAKEVGIEGIQFKPTDMEHLILILKELHLLPA